MAKEDHVFKKVHEVDDVFAAKKAKEQEALSEDFEWSENEEKEGTVSLKVSDVELQEAAAVLGNWVLKSLSPEHFLGATSEGTRMSLEIDLDVHDLLQKRFDDNLILNSRIEMFDRLEESLVGFFMNNKSLLNNKIDEILPSGEDRNMHYVYDKLFLNDDAMDMDGDSNGVSVDIFLKRELKNKES